MKRMTHIQILFFMFTLVVFVVGGYVYSTMDIHAKLENMEVFKNERMEKEGFGGMLIPQNTLEGLATKRDKPYHTQQQQPETAEEDTECPDLLVKVGTELHLYNTKNDNKTPVMTFPSMDQYIQYLETQRKTGNSCPILYLQKENDAQGKDVYRVRPSPFNTGAGLPISSNLNVGVNKTAITVKDASRENQYNTNQYAGFDPYGLYIGRITNVDEIGSSTEKPKTSDNPMDPNWGGVLHTQKSVDSGKYDENNVSRIVYPTPKTAFIPIQNPNIPPLPPPI